MRDQNKMKKNILFQILKLSRPRFWFYTAGTFLVGFVFGAKNLGDFDINFFLWFLYFLIPANLLIYSMNDLADEKIDTANAKKDGKEIKVDNSNRFLVKYAFYFSLIISIVALFYAMQINLLSLILISLFLFLSIFYSLPPLRFKTMVFLDFISNGFYVLPGIFGFYLIGQEIPNIFIIFSALFWAFAMHLFSAVVDIEPDKKANIQTSATFLGRKFSLLFCFLFWFVAWVWIYQTTILNDLIYLYLIYPILPLVFLFKKEINLEKAYWFYPFINMILGFLLFLQAFKKIL